MVTSCTTLCRAAPSRTQQSCDLAQAPLRFFGDVSKPRSCSAKTRQHGRIYRTTHLASPHQRCSALPIDLRPSFTRAIHFSLPQARRRPRIVSTALRAQQPWPPAPTGRRTACHAPPVLGRSLLPTAGVVRYEHSGKGSNFIFGFGRNNWGRFRCSGRGMDGPFVQQ